MYRGNPLAVALVVAMLALGGAACSQKGAAPTTGTARQTDTTPAARTAPATAASGSATSGTSASAAATTAAGAPTTASGSTASATAGPSIATQPIVTSGSAVDVVKALTPSVVRVRTQGTAVGFFGQVQQTSGVGTGIIIDTDGHIVTNNHVVTLDSSQAANNLTVDLWDGRSLSARLVARDPSADLAVLQITAQNLTPAKFADPNSLQVGQDVVAIGYALDLGSTPSVTRGIISALHRDFTETITDVSGRPVQNTIGDVIQTDAAINEGNSGGPLVNLSGEVVGINTGAIRPSTTAANITSQVQGINYAISVQTILPVVRSLITKGNVDRGYLGVNLTQVDRNAASAKQLPVSDGVLISQVVPGGPADRAGLQANDIIVKAGNEDIHTVGDLQQVLIENGPGTKLHIEFYRGNNRQSADVTLGSRPAGT